MITLQQHREKTEQVDTASQQLAHYPFAGRSLLAPFPILKKRKEGMEGRGWL